MKNKKKSKITKENSSLNEHSKLFEGQSSKVPARKLKIIPWQREIQNDLADEMIHWVMNTNSIALENFPISKSYHPTLYYRIADENDYFEMCLGFCRWVISARLQDSAITKSISENYCFKMLPVYNEWYKQMSNERTMNDAKGRALANIIVQQTPIETTAEVDEQLKKKVKAQA